MLKSEFIFLVMWIRNAPQGTLQNKLAELLLTVEDILAATKWVKKI